MADQPDDDFDDDSDDDSEDEDVWDKTKESFSEYERRVNTPRPGDPVQAWPLSDFQPKASPRPGQEDDVELGHEDAQDYESDAAYGT